MENTQTPSCFYLLRNGEDCNFTIESEPNFFPHDGVFAIIVTDQPNKHNLFRALMNKAYDFDSVDEVTHESLLEGYCVYNIGFSEAMILGEMASCESIFYRYLEKIGIYSIASRKPLKEILFEESIYL
ncbi:MAG: hypothetical protein Q8M39_03205 [Sulfuricurvum sp.]|nr:hypothetical protein [Sulfuricurvum sp.]